MMNMTAFQKPEIGSGSFMHVVLESVHCTRCGHRHEGASRKSVLGFKRFTCAGCRKEFDTVLHRRYRVGYWLLLAVFGGIAASHGGRPNLFVILVGLLVALDAWRFVRQRLAG